MPIESFVTWSENCERRKFQYNACMLEWVCTMFQNNCRSHSKVQALYWNTGTGSSVFVSKHTHKTKRSNACICTIIPMRTTKIRVYIFVVLFCVLYESDEPNSIRFLRPEQHAQMLAFDRFVWCASMCRTADRNCSYYQVWTNSGSKRSLQTDDFIEFQLADGEVLCWSLINNRII